MSAKASIKIKATFLLLVFSLNTIVGFACATGLNMGFNAKHHHHHDNDEVSSSNVTHHHEISTQHPEDELNKTFKSAEDDNCCRNQVVKLSQSDKLLAQSVNARIETPTTLVLTQSLYQFYLAPAAKMFGQIQVFRHVFFDSTDIRVSIRSFQI